MPEIRQVPEIAVTINRQEGEIQTRDCAFAPILSSGNRMAAFAAGLFARGKNDDEVDFLMAPLGRNCGNRLGHRRSARNGAERCCYRKHRRTRHTFDRRNSRWKRTLFRA
jgi:hypothetical protein